ncbi:exo-alpha-sialidase [Paenibacillus sp. GD4]|uniref:exo-alpha-sialidase n=1 Tax=Paenibacillus sp. GD4 TaxID=3068890 RepID=UPI002796BDC2|nr:exo-alpha-sialidase [Paenibacillus sp. GD4]MDQ1913592.1 exo-alpha-sialidase [Paenibacillus sp. GD4]
MIRNRVWLVVLVLSLLASVPTSLASGSADADPHSRNMPYFTNTDLYVSGTEGYHTFRIPSLLTTKSGTLLAFAEGRKNSASDTGDIDLVLKRSFDQGRTWQPLQMVCDDGPNTCGNPTPVQDENTGRIWLFMTHNYGEDTIEEINSGTGRGVRTIWSTYSDDDGATWSPRVNRFEEVQPPNTRWDATGPGIGIQLRHGPAQGRLVIPAIGRNIQSDDHGATWYQSGRLPGGLNEATVVELSDGTLMRNDRLSSNQHLKRRGISTSPDQGATWSPITYDPVLIDPICEASIVRYKPADNAEGNRMLLFANPADQNRRENMTVRISYDDGQTWTTSKTVYEGHSAYSSLSVLPDGKGALLFEGGEFTPYDKIMFAVFNMEWFDVEEPDLDGLLLSEGALTPGFRGDIGSYGLELYTGTEHLTVTPVTSNGGIAITINGEPVSAGMPRTIQLNGLDAIRIEAKLKDRIRVYTVGIQRSRPLPELLLHWDFDKLGANGEIVDVTGKGHTGVLSSGALIQPGYAGSGLYLNGQRAFAEMTRTEDLHTGTDDFSFAVWVKPEALFQQRHIIYWYGLAGKGLPQWWFSVEKNGAVRMNMTGIPLEREVGIATIAGMVKPGVWTHLAAVRDGSVNKIYVNGELAATSAQYDSSQMSITNLQSPPRIGFDKGTVANRDWKGHLDDIRFYRHSLSAAKVRELYLQYDVSKPVTQAALSPSVPNGAEGWYTTDVSVTMSVYDEFSGPARTEYRLNGGAWSVYSAPLTVNNEGQHLLEYRSIDLAGNVEDSQLLKLSIDKTAPTLEVTPNRTELWPPNRQWVPVEMSISAADSGSGVHSVKLVSVTCSEGEALAYVREAEPGTDDRTFLLLADRNGSGSGRVYTVEYAVKDFAGHETRKRAVIFVPHDRSK